MKLKKESCSKSRLPHSLLAFRARQLKCTFCQLFSISLVALAMSQCLASGEQVLLSLSPSLFLTRCTQYGHYPARWQGLTQATTFQAAKEKWWPTRILILLLVLFFCFQTISAFSKKSSTIIACLCPLQSCLLAADHFFRTLARPFSKFRNYIEKC